MSLLINTSSLRLVQRHASTHPKAQPKYGRILSLLATKKNTTDMSEKKGKIKLELGSETPAVPTARSEKGTN